MMICNLKCDSTGAKLINCDLAAVKINVTD